MGRRKRESVTDVIRRTAPEVFAGLSAPRFTGPHDIEDGVAYAGDPPHASPSASRPVK